MRQTRLHVGECETIILAGELPGPVTLLIDERRAFSVVARVYPQFPLISLGHVLTTFEEAGDIPSASAVPATLIANGDYAWAPAVQQAYQRWLAHRGRQPGA